MSFFLNLERWYSPPSLGKMRTHAMDFNTDPQLSPGGKAALNCQLTGAENQMALGLAPGIEAGWKYLKCCWGELGRWLTTRCFPLAPEDVDLTA